MTILADEADAAHRLRLAAELAAAEAAAALEAERLAAEAVAAEAERKALRQAAVEALRAVLVRPDGSTLTVTQAGLSLVHTDLTAARLVVWTDGLVSLAASWRNDRWVIMLVQGAGVDWTPVPGRIRDLADLGAARAAA